ncbi:glycoside hydrolase family 25 protein [Paenibacillus thailandensis]|uniref:Glycoside hydrolase family 25 protein n=1 Tax=Paenibacillus thailandensis TaxID=393250 RepID=A0ABW5QZ11_9BACL
MQTRSDGNAQGIDVSRYQGKIDWGKVKADGISFVFAKATESVGYRDPTFEDNIAGAKAAGLATGAYHFVTARTVEAARKEAANFARAIMAVGGVELPPAMDYENNPGNLNKTVINAVARAFLKEIESITGKRPIIYTGNSFAGNFDDSLAAYPLWVARYSNSAPFDVAGWDRWTFWQYSDGGTGGQRPGGGRRVSGIAGPVDLNEYAGTEEDLFKKYVFMKEEEPMTEAEKQQVAALENRIAALEAYLNTAGDANPPAWAKPAAEAALKAGIVTSVDDKGRPEIITIQMLYNAGLCNAELIKFFKSFSASTRKAIEELEKKN